MLYNLIPFRRTRKFKCPDGREPIVFKNPDDAFPLIAKDWSARFNAVCNALKELQGNLGAQFEKQIEGFFVQLDQANFSMQSQFRAIYIVFQTDPCNQNDYLSKGIKKIIEIENTHRKMQIEISRIEILISQGSGSKELLQALTDSQKRLLKSDIEENISKEFQKVEENTLAWSEGS